MGGNIFEWLFGQAADVFGLSGKSGLEEAITNLFRLGIPDLGNNWFQGRFAVVFAFALIMAIIAGTFSSLLYLGKGAESVEPVGFSHRLFFFVRVFVFSMLMLPMAAGCLYVADIISKGAGQFSGAEDKVTWLMRLQGFMGSLTDIPVAGLLSFFSWSASWMLNFESALLYVATFPLLLLTPVFYALSIAGSGAFALYRFWLGLVAVAVFSKPLIVWILAVGNVFSSWTKNELGMVPGAAFLSLMTMLFAAFVPLILIVLFKTKVAPRLQPAYVSVNSKGSDGVSSGLVFGGLAATAGVLHHLNSGRSSGSSSSSSSTPRTSSAARANAHQALVTVGTTVARAHPATAVAAQAAALLVKPRPNKQSP